MLHRQKHVGKSVYRVVRIEGGFSIMEEHLGRSAVAPRRYDTAEDALEALRYFDREKLIIGDFAE